MVTEEEQEEEEQEQAKEEQEEEASDLEASGSSYTSFGSSGKRSTSPKVKINTMD
jgi:hypothetical protein